MNYIKKSVEYGLYLLVFLLPIQTRWIIRAGEINGGVSEYLTLSLYGTDILLTAIFFLHLIVILKEAKQCEESREMSTNDELRMASVDCLCNSARSASVVGEPREECSARDSLAKFQDDKKAHYKISRIWILIAILEIAIFISIFFASDKLAALQNYLRFLLGVALFFLIIKVNYRHFKLVFSFLAGVFLQAILAIWQFFIQSAFANKWLGLAGHNPAELGQSVVELANGERWLRAYGILDHPNILGGYLALGIILLLLLRRGTRQAGPQFDWGTRQSHEKLLKILSSLIFNPFFLVLLTTALFYTFSRSAWLALIIGILFYILPFPAECKRREGNSENKNILNLKSNIFNLSVVIITLTSLSFIYSDLVKTRISGTARLEQKSTVERVASIKDSFQIIKQNPIFGVGIGNYVNGLKELYPEQESWFYQPVHNTFLLILAEIGIFGLLSFTLMLLLVFQNSTLNIDSKFKIQNSKFNIIIMLIIIMFLDHYLWSLHFGILLFWLTLGIVYKKSVQ